MDTNTETRPPLTPDAIAALWRCDICGGTHTPLADRIQRLAAQGARFQLTPGEEGDPLVRALTDTGIARTFRDGTQTWLELAD